jgi:hypothetical protein
MRSREIFCVVLITVLVLAIIPPVQGDAISSYYLRAISRIPNYQMTAQDYLQAGDTCAAECELQKKEYMQRVELFRVSETYYTPQEKEACKNPANRFFCEGKARSYDTDVASSYDGMMANCNCAQKNYNAALAATKLKDYEGQARILESASGMYATLEMTKEQDQFEKAALAARAMADAQRLSLPLPAWIAVCGIIGGLLLIQRKRK